MARSTTNAFHQYLRSNTAGRDFFLGDVHGRLDALFLAIGDVSFDPKKDRIISVGDLVDRGLNSYEVLKLTRQPWFFAVRGNHECMMLDTNDHFSLVQWLSNGGGWFMDLDGESSVDSYALANSLPTAITVDTPDGEQIGVCHAEWPEEDWADIDQHLKNPTTIGAMVWGRSILKNRKQKWDKTAILTVHGHSPVEEVIKLGSAIYIDTGCVHGGKLTLIERSAALNWPLAGNSGD